MRSRSSVVDGPRPHRDHPVTAYARAVVEARIVAGRLVRLACERHLRDLRELVGQGYRFDEARADHAIEFFPNFLRLYDAGEKTGEPFTLGPAWIFIVGSLFGWRGPDGYRRFRIAYIEMGKGNAKTPALAGIGLYGITVDDEPGAQVFCAAVTREQARILFDDAKNLANLSEALQRELVIGENNIAHTSSRSFLRPVSSEGRSLDAKRVHMALIDEVHEHRTPAVVDKLTLGVKGRRQPLVCEITNSGYDRASVCWRERDLSRRILEQLETNEARFAYVCQLDPCEACREKGFEMPQENCRDCDDWRNEAVWLKANPNLDISVTREYLRKTVRDATQMPSLQNLVRRLSFCTWTETATRWFTSEQWKRGARPVDPAALRGRRCVAGIDLATTTDLAALILVFPDDDFFVEVVPPPLDADFDAPPTLAVGGEVAVLAFFWCPDDGVTLRSRKDRVPYEFWANEGALERTPGNAIDYRRIRRRIQQLRDDGYDIAEICYDPAFATQIALQLQDEDGFTCVSVPQTFQQLNEPAMLLETLVLRGGLRHGGQPVLAWNAGNVQIETDAGGRKRPSKGKSTERIDGISALVTALKRVVILGRKEEGAQLYVCDPDPEPPEPPESSEPPAVPAPTVVADPEAPAAPAAARREDSSDELWRRDEAWRTF